MTATWGKAPGQQFLKGAVPIRKEETKVVDCSLRKILLQFL